MVVPGKLWLIRPSPGCFLSGPPPSQPQDSYNLGNEYASGDYDIRHHLSFSLTYALPGRKSPLQLLEGWQINSVVALQSGLPWTAMDNNNEFLGTGEVNNGAGPGRWNFTGNRSDFKSIQFAIPFFSSNNADGSAPATLAQAVANLPAACVSAVDGGGDPLTPSLAMASLVNSGCYMKGSSVLTPPAYGTAGMAGRNIFRDSGFKNLDLSVYKTWKIKERYSAEFRAEFFNILNHPNFANPYGGRNGYLNNDPSSGATGTFGCGCVTPDAAATNPVVGSGGARDVQLGLKLTF